MSSKTYVVALQVTEAEGALRSVARGMLAKVRLDITAVDGAFITQSGLLSVSGAVVQLSKASGAKFPVRDDLTFERVQANIVAGTVNFRIAKGPIVGTVVAEFSKDWKTIDSIRIEARCSGGEFAQYITHLIAIGKGRISSEVADAPKATKIHATDFLNFGATVRCAFHLLDPRNDAAAKREAIAYLGKNGYTTAYVCAAIEGDRGGKFRVGGNVTTADARKWVKAVRDAGLAVWIWLRSDDSPVQNKWTEGEFNAFAQLLHGTLGDLVDGYVLGIECNEWGWGEARVKRHCAEIRKITGKPVGVHTGSIEHIAFADAADVYFLQYGFNKASQNITGKTKQAKARWGGKKPVIACEYNLHGETDEAKRMGEEAVRAGADGFGNGGTALAMQMLRERGDGEQAVPEVPVVPGQARLLSVTKASKPMYIRWQAEGIEDWPTKPDKKRPEAKPLKGWIVIKGVRVEQFREGYTEQHLNNAKGSDEHGVSIKTGEVVPVELQSTDLKRKTTTFLFTWPWGQTR